MRIRSIAASLLSLAAVPLLAGGALANHTSVAALSGDAGERVIFNDANGEATASVDIARVTASLVGEHDDRVRLKVAFAQIQKSGDHTAVYFDRNRSNPGPELRLSGIVGSEYWLDRVDSWNEPGRSPPTRPADGRRVRVGRRVHLTGGVSGPVCLPVLQHPYVLAGGEPVHAPVARVVHEVVHGVEQVVVGAGVSARGAAEVGGRLRRRVTHPVVAQ
jgi:hypothetical protein